MAQPRVAIRLGTEGKSEVKRDFVELGDAGDAAANRAARSFDKASQDIESAVRRQAAAADKLRALTGSAFLSQPTQAVIDARQGGGPSATDMGATFTALIAQQEQYEQRAIAVRAALDPLWAAQQRYNAELNEARTLHAAGALSAELLEQKERQLKQALDETTEAHRRGGASMGAVRAGAQQLTYNLNDMVTMWGLGAKPMQIFVSQAGQTVQAIGLMTNGAKGFIGFIGGPWGLAITSGITLLATLALNSEKTSDALDKVKFSSSAVGDAQSILGNVLDLTTGKINKQNAALIGLAQAQLAVARVQAQARQAEARSEVRSMQDRNMEFYGGIGGGIGFWDTQPGAAKAISRDVLAGNLTSSEAVKRLDNLRRAGALTEEAFAKAAAAVANFGVEAENLKVYDSAQRLLDGVGTPGDQALLGKPGPKGRKPAKSEAEKEAERQAREWRQFLLSTEQGVNSWAYGYPLGQSATDSLTKQGEDLQRINDLMRDQRADAAAGTILLNLEWEMRGKSRQEIEKALELRRYQIDLEKQFPPELLAGNEALQQQVRQLLDAKQAQLDMADAVDKTRVATMDWRGVGEDAIGGIFDIRAAQSWGSRVKSILLDIANEMIRLQAIKLFLGDRDSSGSGQIGGLIGSIIKRLGSSNGGSAIGNEYTPAGAMLVGENGPEIVDMPRGARVMTASDSRRALGGSNPMHVSVPISISADGADPAQLQRLTQEVAELRRTLPGQIVQTVQEAKDRLVLRNGF